MLKESCGRGATIKMDDELLLQPPGTVLPVGKDCLSFQARHWPLMQQSGSLGRQTTPGQSVSRSMQPVNRVSSLVARGAKEDLGGGVGGACVDRLALSTRCRSPDFSSCLMYPKKHVVDKSYLRISCLLGG